MRDARNAAAFTAWVKSATGRGGAELEAWSLKKEADYFREVFDRDLAVEVA
jgi:exopolyphosphatase/guanosine-5'-triphosphate,3'-diphosphate pyrophosphatase